MCTVTVLREGGGILVTMNRDERRTRAPEEPPRLLGAEVILTPPHEGTDGAIRRAHQMMEDSPDEYFMPNQFANANNILAHYETTGPEIWEQTDGALDVFVGGMGATGTLMASRNS